MRWLICRKDNYETLHVYLEREVLDLLPSDSHMYIPSDPQTYVSSFAKDFLSSISSYFSTLAPPSGIDPYKYQEFNYAVPRINLAIEAVILIAKQDQASGSFSWDAARQACNELQIKYPELEEEAETLLIELIMSLRSSAEVRLCGLTSLLCIHSPFLQFYMEVLGNPDMARRIKENVFRVAEAPDPDMIPQQPGPNSAPREEISQPSLDAGEIPTAPSTVQPERAQRYFENVPDEFGAWHIFVCRLMRCLKKT